MSNINWENLNFTKCSANSLYKTFLNFFNKKGSTKQRLYIKFLKNKTNESEEKHKNYKTLFEKLKIKSKQLLCFFAK